MGALAPFRTTCLHHTACDLERAHGCAGFSSIICMKVQSNVVDSCNRGLTRYCAIVKFSVSFRTQADVLVTNVHAGVQVSVWLSDHVHLNIIRGFCGSSRSCVSVCVCMSVSYHPYGHCAAFTWLVLTFELAVNISD